MIDARPPETVGNDPATGARIAWDDLEQALRRAGEAVRTAPRQVPLALQSALGALRAAREGLGTRAPDFASGLTNIEASLRAAGENLRQADRWITGARSQLASLRARSASV